MVGRLPRQHPSRRPRAQHGKVPLCPGLHSAADNRRSRSSAPRHGHRRRPCGRHRTRAPPAMHDSQPASNLHLPRIIRVRICVRYTTQLADGVGVPPRPPAPGSDRDRSRRIGTHASANLRLPPPRRRKITTDSFPARRIRVQRSRDGGARASCLVGRGAAARARSRFGCRSSRQAGLYWGHRRRG
jgi:hypothetical protein